MYSEYIQNIHYFRKERLKNNQLLVQSNKLENKQQKKKQLPIQRKQKEIMKIRAECKDKLERINKTKIWFFMKIKKLEKPMLKKRDGISIQY